MCKITPGSNQRQPELIDTPKLKFKRRLRMEMDATGTSEKAVAMEARIDPGQFSRMLDATYTEALHAHHIPAVVRECGPGFMEWVAIQCGGTYIHDSASTHVEAPPGMLTGMLAHEVGDVVQQVFQDLLDGSWSKEERISRIAALRKVELIAKSLREDAEEGV